MCSSIGSTTKFTRTKIKYRQTRKSQHQLFIFNYSFLIVNYIIMSVIHISSVEEFKKEILEHKWVSVIDFRAERCGPCRMLGPIIEELGEQHKEIKVAKVDVDKQQELAAAFQVSSIPVVYFIKDGQVVDKVIGANPATVYEEKIVQHSTPAKTAA